MIGPTADDDTILCLKAYYIMEKNGINQELAYKKLMKTELYKLLNDVETRLYLKTNIQL